MHSGVLHPTVTLLHILLFCRGWAAMHALGCCLSTAHVRRLISLSRAGYSRCDPVTSHPALAALPQRLGFISASGVWKCSGFEGLIPGAPRICCLPGMTHHVVSSLPQTSSGEMDLWLLQPKMGAPLAPELPFYLVMRSFRGERSPCLRNRKTKHISVQRMVGFERLTLVFWKRGALGCMLHCTAAGCI